MVRLENVDGRRIAFPMASLLLHGSRLDTLLLRHLQRCEERGLHRVGYRAHSHGLYDRYGVQWTYSTKCGVGYPHVPQGHHNLDERRGFCWCYAATLAHGLVRQQASRKADLSKCFRNFATE